MGQIQREDVLKLRDHMVKLCQRAEEQASAQALRSARYPDDEAERADCQRAIAKMDAFAEFKDYVMSWIGHNWPT